MAVSVVAASAACGAVPDEVPHGSWGGVGAALEVDAQGADVELDCAHGRIEEPLRLDDEGRFRAAGFLAFEGGPVTQEGFDRRSATYDGSLDGQRLELRVATAGSEETIGPLLVVFGEAPRLLKCLPPQRGT